VTVTTSAPPLVVAVPRAQQRLWLADQLTPGGAYLGCRFLRLRGDLDVAALQRAFVEIVTRHEVLRTSLTVGDDGQVVGLLRAPDELSFEVRRIAPADLDAGLDAALRSEAAAPMDVSTDLPMRVVLLRLAPDDHVLGITVHHLAFDGGSFAILYRELSALYGGGTLAPLARQFRSIAGDDDAREEAGELAPMLAERQEALADRSSFELAPDHPRPATRSGQGELVDGFDLPAATVDRLVRIGRDQGASLYMVLLAGCWAVLRRYTSRTDVTTGTSSSTRHDADGAAAIGPFLNMLALPGDLAGNPTFAELVRRARDVALDAYEARLVAFDTLVAEVGVPRDPARTPLFQVLVDFTVPVGVPDLGDVWAEDIPTPGAGSKYDLTFELHRTEDGGIGCRIEWDTALYDPATVTRLGAHLRCLLTALAGDPGRPVDDVAMLTATETRELQALATGAPVEPATRGLHELFAEQVARTPDAVAVQDDRGSLTYAELERRAATIAAALAAAGVERDVPVGVVLERSVDLVAALYGILMAGGAYLPFDPESSPARIGRLLAAARALLCLVPPDGDGDETATEADVEAVRTAAGEVGCRAVDVDELLRLGRTAAPADPGPLRPGDLCAVYFTSGSTGEPKAVACTHAGWVGQMRSMQERYRLAPGDTVLLKTPAAFDDVAREIFWPLMLGARVVALGPGLHRDPRALLAAAAEHRAAWLQFVPGMLALFLDEVGTDQVDRLDGLGHLRDVVSDGDRLPPTIVDSFFAGLGARGCRLHNHWGTTEVSIDSTHRPCRPADGTGGSAADAVALGRPMEGTEVYVLDDDLRLVPPGAIGELCLGGDGLGRGYLHDPGRTARAFVPHPWRPGQRLYRTGDTGRLLPDGSLRYCGRRDHQVKVRGVRIELGEVEAAVRAFPGVRDAVAVVREPTPGDHRLVAYAATDDAQRARLHDFLVERLAPAAVPSAIVLVPALPHHPSGKLDRRSLPAPDLEAGREAPFVPAETDTQQALAEIWAGLLGVARLGADDDFFAAGGHSLLVTRAVNRMRDAFTLDVPVRFVFENSTVRGAAARIEELVLAEIEALSDAEAARLAADIAPEPPVTPRPQEPTHV
jgi:amino acid adenylation domain-containing protein